MQFLLVIILRKESGMETLLVHFVIKMSLPIIVSLDVHMQKLFGGFWGQFWGLHLVLNLFGNALLGFIGSLLMGKKFT